MIAVYLRTSGNCGICGVLVGAADATIDHIIPLARGGADTLDNWQIAHRRCNSQKRDRLPDESPQGNDSAPVTGKKLLRVTEAARVIRISAKTLRKWTDAGLVRAGRLAGRGDRRYTVDELARVRREVMGMGDE